jgi:hypothetical protein
MRLHVAKYSLTATLGLQMLTTAISNNLFEMFIFVHFSIRLCFPNCVSAKVPQVFFPPEQLSVNYSQ